jgi:hypothetical protein
MDVREPLWYDALMAQMKKRNKKRGQLSCIPRRQLSSPQKTFRPADQRKEGGRIFMIQDICFDIKTYINSLSAPGTDGKPDPDAYRDAVMEICTRAGIPDAVLDGRYLRSFIVFREDADTGTVLRAAAAGRPLAEICALLDALTCHVTVPVIRIKDREKKHSHAILPCDAVPFWSWSLPVLLLSSAVMLIRMSARSQGKSSERGRGPSHSAGGLPLPFTPGILRAIKKLAERERDLLSAACLHDAADPLPVREDPLSSLTDGPLVRAGPLAVCWRCLERQLFVRRKALPPYFSRSLLITPEGVIHVSVP